MSYVALYRKWRPLKFEDVVEQEHVVKTLKNAVEQDRIAHAYLFCGTRGTGKTTMAKILSRAVNCLNPQNGNPCNECAVCKGILDGSNLDVVEIDAASNNSVDNIREIRDEVMYTPSQSKYKVYIIDEVHMLSIGAFNALLKTLEEPPNYVIFILATTEANKLPATILSRCQRFDFKRISVNSIKSRLEKIIDSMGIEFEEDAVTLIAKVADGALRDAISILDQCVALGQSKVSYDDVLDVVGMLTTDFVINIVDSILKKDIANIIEQMDVLVCEGKDIAQFLKELIQYFRNMLICKVTANAEDLIEVSKDVLEDMKNKVQMASVNKIILIIKELSALENKLKWSQNQRILLEVTLIKICEENFINDGDSVLDKLMALEEMVGNIANNKIVVTRNVASKPKEEPVAKKPKAKKNTIMEVGEEYPNWGVVLNSIKQSRIMHIWVALDQSRAFILDADTIGIVLDHKTAYEVINKFENLSIIKKCIEDLEGREIAIKTVSKDTEVHDIGKGKKAKEDFISKAKNIANQNDIEINILDE